MLLTVSNKYNHQEFKLLDYNIIIDSLDRIEFIVNIDNKISQRVKGRSSGELAINISNVILQFLENQNDTLLLTNKESHNENIK